MAIADGWYHVTSRGIDRRAIFHDDHDRRHFLDLLGALPERFGIRIHAYVLMTNHYHVLVQTPQGNLSQGIHWLNCSYGIWSNCRHRRVGPLYQGRFKAVVVDGEGSWALDLGRYIHLNPIRTKRMNLGKKEQKVERMGWALPDKTEAESRVEALRAYRWSSYRAYAGYASLPEWLTSDTLMGRLSEAKRKSPATYRRWVEEGVLDGKEESPWLKMKGGLALGSERFLSVLRKMVKGDRREQTPLRKLESDRTFDQVVKAVETAKGEKWETFRDRRGDEGRDLALWLARKHCRMTLKALGDKAGGMDYLAVSKAVSRMAERLNKDRTIRQILAKAESDMSNV
ncbi:MAG TPA: transposase [Kiritimatiellia bacterium]|nr:transposase [Kiritimatiellia bacterium]HRZ11388.1 transposase [Kiritimatiellia bacterium]HSA17061.1 transposase [Kiritimatiellia bacterium]